MIGVQNNYSWAKTVLRVTHSLLYIPLDRAMYVIKRDDSGVGQVILSHERATNISNHATILLKVKRELVRQGAGSES